MASAASTNNAVGIKVFLAITADVFIRPKPVRFAAAGSAATFYRYEVRAKLYMNVMFICVNAVGEFLDHI